MYQLMGEESKPTADMSTYSLSLPIFIYIYIYLSVYGMSIDLHK